MQVIDDIGLRPANEDDYVAAIKTDLGNVLSPPETEPNAVDRAIALLYKIKGKHQAINDCLGYVPPNFLFWDFSRELKEIEDTLLATLIELIRDQ